ncbi:MAG: TetR/AcrR family transcriptional regulator C-terminal ligand-binding domain-containing protein [Rhodobacteraceae bacterium]|nr:TetR/AcrR family transcriptional regulator C-terminal ligand-binding domain-containing protein [Paracoccaceae bacterium]
MTIQEIDPRITQTRAKALEAALMLIRDCGIGQVTHQSVSAKSGISRSTLYRHWPEVSDLLNDAFVLVSKPPISEFVSQGSLKADLYHLLSGLVSAIQNTEWGKIVPQLIAAAAVNKGSADLLHEFVQERLEVAEQIILAARRRGEYNSDITPENFLILIIAPVYYRFLLAGFPIDDDWIEGHVNSVSPLFKNRSR